MHVLDQKKLILLFHVYISTTRGFQSKTYPHLYTQVKSSQVNFMSNIRIYIHKKVQFSITEINIEIKTIATAVIKNEYFFKSIF